MQDTVGDGVLEREGERERVRERGRVSERREVMDLNRHYICSQIKDWKIISTNMFKDI